MSFYKMKRALTQHFLTLLAVILVPLSLAANDAASIEFCEREAELVKCNLPFDLFEDLGVPSVATLAVVDLDGVKSQLSAAMGIDWRDETQETRIVFLPGVGVKLVHFRRVLTKPGSPYLELVEANPPIGPWAATADDSPGYLGWSVDNVLLQGLQLCQAGFKKIAGVSNRFAIYEGPGGVRVELVRSDLIPACSETYTSQAAIDLGAPHHLGWSINGSHIQTIKNMFAEAFSLTWEEDAVYPEIPFYFSEASGAAADGIYLMDISISGTLDLGPRIALESGEFYLSPCDCNPCTDPCKLSPFNSTETTAVFHPGVWAVPTADVQALIAQWQNAGLVEVMSYDPGTGQPILAFWKGIGGILYEYNDEAIIPPSQ